jgi:hypothetical protein
VSDENPTEATKPGETPASTKDQPQAALSDEGAGDNAASPSSASEDKAGMTSADADDDAKSADSRGKPDDDAKKAVESKKDAPGEPASTSEDGKNSKAPNAKKEPETWTNTFIWIGVIVLALGIELFIYGHDGRIQVCVGIDKLTDYAIRNEPRTKENAVKHPFCAERLNLGMWSSSEKHSKAALTEACSAAARVVGAEHRQKCLRRDEPWTRFVETEHIMPWDSRLYRRLFWLD